MKEKLNNIAAKLCDHLECEFCPVYIYNYDKRTEHEKKCLDVSCCENLVKWFEEEC